MELIKFIDNEMVIKEDVIAKLKSYNEIKLKADLLEQELKQELMEVMKQYDIKSWENDLFTAIYVNPTSRKSLDSKKLKEDMPDIFEEYQRESNVKESLRIRYND